MKTAGSLATLLTVAAVVALAGADRQWQTGTWTDVGVKRTATVGDPVHERMPSGFNKPQMTEVATYVIETLDRRYELQDMVAIGREGLELHVTVGQPVTFAVEKKTAYIKLDAHEYRLLVVKSERRRKP